MPPSPPKCDLTPKDCPTENFSIDEDKCECVCDTYCIATTSLNMDTCTCEPISPPKPPKPPCELTPDQCGASEFWVVDRRTCSCQCDIVCIATMSVDKDTCSCVPIEPEPMEDKFDCDKEGNKICPADPITCPQGNIYDDEACMCMSLIQCRRACPPGQGLDPRENC